MKEKIQENLNTAMRGKNVVVLAVLRSVKAAITVAEKSQGDKPLTDLEVLQIVRKQISQREQAMDAYLEGNRMDLYAKELLEQQILESYLPISLTFSELDEMISQAINETMAIHMKDRGKVIKRTLELVQGRIDNKTISQRVGELLTN